ncbi:MAG: class I SAM-dependent methyltransferase [Acidimicrobiia bacterium]|nr:class I SAM-dependent methyltransferase [Acidimicrobiia bacterium]
MFPFWDPVIAPAIRAVDARRIVEIGALRGDTTIRMLDELGPDAELHVIDPVPAFDPTDHEKAFPGQYLFYRELSHRVLPSLPAMDVALVDGDHNWFTVYHELHHLAETSRAADQPLPLLILHDVGWPYGRRDLYYDPETIPEEFRQPYTQAGIMPGKKELAFVGGLNPTMNNAVEEGGPRNGVMTALDDFIDEYDHPLRKLVIPIYFGLAIVADERRLADHPRLTDFLDWLETAEDAASCSTSRRTCGCGR